MASTDQTEPTYYGHRPEGSPLPEAWWRVPLRTRQWIAGGVAVVLFLLVALAISLLLGGGDDETATVAGADAPAEPDEPDAAEFVRSLPAPRVAIWDDLAQCETEGKWDTATGNGFYGGLQFTQASWLEVGGTDSPHQASREEQIMRAEFLHDLQGWSAWPNCSVQLGLE